MIEDGLVQVRELQRQLQKMRKHHEGVEERNEELEALLGETQNVRTEERLRHEGELEGLQRKVLLTRLESRSHLFSDPVHPELKSSRLTCSVYFNYSLSNNNTLVIADKEPGGRAEKARWPRQSPD